MRAAFRFVAIGVGLVCAVMAMTPWRVVGTHRIAEIEADISDVAGLSVRVGGPITLKLLPRPRVQMTDVAIQDAGGALAAYAPVLYGDLDLPALIKGKWRLVSATLGEPTVTLDGDKASTAAARAEIRAPSGSSTWPAFKLSLRSGVIRVLSRSPDADTLLTDVSATAHQSADLDGSLAISGSAVWHAARGQFTARLAHPRAVLNGGNSAASLQLTSAIGSFSAVGDLSGGTQRQFSGRLALSSNALPRLFTALNLPAPWLSVQRASLAGDAIAKVGEVSISSSVLRLDDTTLEGTLGLHRDGDRSLIEGTLATDYLDLSRLAARGLDPQRAAAIYHESLGPDLLLANIDLRVSASVARWGDVEVQDAALSALSNDGRVEVTLGEASAFNGIVKAHAVASLGAAGVETHANLSVSNVDLGPLCVAMFGQERATGALTGKIEIGGQGRSLSEIVHAAHGEGQASVEGGNVMGLSVTQALKRLTRKLPLISDQTAQITSFDTASTAIRVVQGMVDFVDGRVTGPGIQLSFGGHSDLPQGKIDILAVAAQTDAAGSVLAGGPRLPFEMHGTWGAPLTLVEHARGLGGLLPALPIIGPGQVVP